MKIKPSPKSAFFNTRVLLSFCLCAAGTLLAMLSFAAPGAHQPAKATAGFKPVVRYSLLNGVSPKLRDLPVIRSDTNGNWEANPLRQIHPLHAPPELPVYDPVQQTIMGALAMPAPLLTFEGMNQAEGCGGCIPPDPNGAVGPSHYVEMVNSSYSVYDKTGTRLVGPVHINQLWVDLPGQCNTDNDGDPIVIYDHLADRFVLTQFAVNGGNGPFAQCIAVSTSPDPTGSYYVYEFDQPVFNDYPHFGVWPDAYYMTVNQFGGTGTTFSGAGAYAYERDKILHGQPARVVFFDLGPVNSSFFGMLPSHLDGQPPPVGSPNYFAEVDSQINSPSLGADALRIWKFHVDWSNTANSTFGLSGQPNSVVPVATWTPAQCIQGQGTCVPQLGSPYQVDAIGDRLMFRAAYRNFGDHEALVINHSAVADARIGVRWYEVRSPGSTPVIYQQSTFAPVDTLYRWMGSIAMDHFGDIALAYSTSSSASFPSLAYAGRLAGDPINQLAQGETQMFAGAGSENVAFYVPPLGRWGDYTDLTVDPTDGCTFWYVNEYFGSEGTTDPGAPWRTRIGSFKFSTCVATPLQLVSVVSRKTHGNAGTFDVNLPLNGSGVECRSGGSNGNFTLVFTFANVLQNVADATVSSGAGSVTGSAIGGDPHQYIVNLTGVANAQVTTVKLTNLYDSAGNSTSALSVSMGVLLGDVDASRRVDSGDVFLARQQTLQPLPPAGNGDFRRDIDVSGRIDSGDVFIARQQTTTTLP
jgi:hypothetical protein